MSEGREPGTTGQATAGQTTAGPVAQKSMTSKIGNVAAASAAALIFGELVTFAQTIALARMLTPTEVGLFVSGTVLATFLGNFVEGGLRSGLIHRDSDLPRASETVFWVTAIAGLGMSLLTLATSPVVAWAFDNREAGLIAAATSGVLFLYSFTNVPEALLQREFSVLRRLVVGPTVAVTYAAVAVSLAAAGWGVWAMVAGFYASYVAWVISLWCITDWRPGRVRPSVKLWRELAHYGMPLVLGMIGARIHSMIESVVVGRGLSQTDLGYYRYGQRVSMIPVSAIIEVGAVALFPAFSRIAGDAERLRPAFLRALKWAMLGAAAMSALMVALGEPAVVVLFGDKWRDAGVVVIAMAGLGVGKAIISVSEEAIKGAGRTQRLNWYTAVEVAVGIGLLLALIGPLGLVGVGLSVSITALVVAVTCLYLAKPIVGFGWGAVVGSVLPQIVCAAGAGAVCAALEHLLLHSDARPAVLGVVLLALDALVFAVMYLALLWLFVRDDARAIVHLMRIGVTKVLGRGGRESKAETAEGVRIGPNPADTESEHAGTV